MSILTRRRSLVPALVMLLLAGLSLTVFVRGTWADTAPREPASGSDGPIARVVQTAAGKEVCAAIRLSFPMDEVWRAITDYEHYGDICSFIHGAELTRGPDGCRVVGQARTPLPCDVPFTIELKQEQELFEYRSSWDESSGDVLVNRGGWVVRPAGEDETLLMLRLEVQVRGVPTFLLRNLSRHRLCEVLRAVHRRLLDGPSGKPW
jgi:hypothetical protein